MKRRQRCSASISAQAMVSASVGGASATRGILAQTAPKEGQTLPRRKVALFPEEVPSAITVA